MPCFWAPAFKRNAPQPHSEPRPGALPQARRHNAGVPHGVPGWSAAEDSHLTPGAAVKSLRGTTPAPKIQDFPNPISLDNLSD